MVCNCFYGRTTWLQSVAEAKGEAQRPLARFVGIHMFLSRRYKSSLLGHRVSETRTCWSLIYLCLLVAVTHSMLYVVSAVLGGSFPFRTVCLCFVV